MLDTKALAAATASIVREHVDKAVAPLVARIGELEKQLAEDTEKRKANEANPEEVADIVSNRMAAELDELRAAVEAVKAPEIPDIPAMVAEAVAAIPSPKDGKDGADGRDGCDAMDAMQDKDGNLVITFSDGRMKNVGLVCGKDGQPGKDGQSADTDGLIERVLEAIPAPTIAPELDYAPDDVAESITLAVKTMAGYVSKAAHAHAETREPAAPISIHLPEVNVTYPEQPVPVVNVAAPVVNVAAPKRGKEITRVTEWDKAGRIKAFEKTEED